MHREAASASANQGWLGVSICSLCTVSVGWVNIKTLSSALESVQRSCRHQRLKASAKLAWHTVPTVHPHDQCLSPGLCHSPTYKQIRLTDGHINMQVIWLNFLWCASAKNCKDLLSEVSKLWAQTQSGFPLFYWQKSRTFPKLSSTLIKNLPGPFHTPHMFEYNEKTKRVSKRSKPKFFLLFYAVFK